MTRVSFEIRKPKDGSHLDECPGGLEFVVETEEVVESLLGQVELGQELAQLGALRDEVEKGLGQDSPGVHVVVGLS